MAGFDCHGRWVQQFGDPENFDVLVLADSQLRPKCERPGDFITVPGMLIWSGRSRGKELYGGAHPVKDLKYRDNIHINDFEVNQLLGCLYEITDIFLGPHGPPREVAGRCLTTCPQMKFKF